MVIRGQQLLPKYIHVIYRKQIMCDREHFKKKCW